MSRFTIIALCFCVLTVNGVVGQDEEVCLTLPRNSIPTNQRLNQGAPGKQGPVGATGSKGVQGEKGEPGDVESCGCNPGDIAELREQVRALRDSHYCPGGLIYNNQCIRLPYASGPGVNFIKAEQVCSDLNATLAEITSDEMYSSVYEYVKKSWVQYTDSGRRSWNQCVVWLGSRFEPTTSNTDNLITLRNGTNVRSGNWYPGYPYKGSSRSTYVRLIMIVQTRDDSSSKGIINYPPTFTDPVPLCATQLPSKI